MSSDWEGEGQGGGVRRGVRTSFSLFGYHSTKIPQFIVGSGYLKSLQYRSLKSIF